MLSQGLLNSFWVLLSMIKEIRVLKKFLRWHGQDLAYKMEQLYFSPGLIVP